MTEYIEPIDWVDNQKIRARNLNDALFYTMGWLKDRPIDVVTIPVQAANKSITSTAWTKLEVAYRLSLVLPVECNVLLLCSAEINAAGGNHRVWMDIVRDSIYWLSSPTGAKPLTSNDGLAELNGNTVEVDYLNLVYWDKDVAAGTHTWDLAFVQASNSFEIRQLNTAWQFAAIAW